MVFENPNDRALLERELEKQSLTLKQLESVIDSVVPIISEVIKTAAEIAAVIGPAVLDAVVCTINTDSKSWRYYKHAKKFRTRKKYQNRLLKNATEIIKKRGF